MPISHVALLDAHAAYFDIERQQDDGVCHGFNSVFLNHWLRGNERLVELQALLKLLAEEAKAPKALIDKMHQSMNWQEALSKQLSEADKLNYQKLAALLEQIELYQNTSKYSKLFGKPIHGDYYVNVSKILQPQWFKKHLIRKGVAVFDITAFSHFLAVLEEVLAEQPQVVQRFTLSISTGTHQVSIVFCRPNLWALVDINQLTLPFDWQEKKDVAASFFNTVAGVNAKEHALLKVIALSTSASVWLTIQINKAFKMHEENGQGHYVNAAGTTLLHFDSSYNNVTLATQAINEGVDPNMIDTRGRSPLYAAAMMGDVLMISLLIKHGADVNGTESDKVTPLYVACYVGSKSAVKMLLANGADPMLAVCGDYTPLSCARSRGHDEVVALLEMHIAQKDNEPARLPGFFSHKKRQGDSLEACLPHKKVMRCR